MIVLDERKRERLRRLAQHARGAVLHDLDDSDDPVLISSLVEAVEALAEAVELLVDDGEAPRSRTPELPRLLRRDEAARHLGLSIRTLERLEAQGKLRVVRLSARAVRVPRDEVLRLAQVVT